MNTSPVFDWLATELEQHTGLDGLKSRGTLRLALHGAGLEPRTLTKDQAAVVIAKILPKELKLRGFVSGPNVCMHLAAALRLMAFAHTGPEAAETAFARLGRK